MPPERARGALGSTAVNAPNSASSLCSYLHMEIPAASSWKSVDAAIRGGLQLVSPKSSDQTSTEAGSVRLAGALLIIVPTNQIRRRRCGLRSSKFTELLSGHSVSAASVHALPHAHQSVSRLIATKFIIQHRSAENVKIRESGTARFDVSQDCTAVRVLPLPVTASVLLTPSPVTHQWNSEHLKWHHVLNAS